METHASIRHWERQRNGRRHHRAGGLRFYNATKFAVEGLSEALAVDSPEPPLRLPLGADAYRRIEAKLGQLSTKIAIWKDRATATGFAD